MIRPKERHPSFSETIMTEIVHPNDTNPMGILQGGQLIQWMDVASAVTAQTHAGRICVTASVDQVTFANPAKVGDIITIRAKVTRTFRSSMEIHVQATARKIITNETYLINEAFFTFVAIDEMSKPVEVPTVKPETAAEKKQYKEALARRNNRLSFRKKKK